MPAPNDDDENLRPPVVEWCDKGSAGVYGVLEDGDQENFLSRVQERQGQHIDPMTNCLKCGAVVRCRIPKRANTWYRIHYKNLVSEKHKGHCECPGEPKRRTFVWRDNGTRPLWIASKDLASAKAKERKRRRIDNTSLFAGGASAAAPLLAGESSDTVPLLGGESSDASSCDPLHLSPRVEETDEYQLMPIGDNEDAENASVNSFQFAQDLAVADEPETLIQQLGTKTETAKSKFLSAVNAIRISHFTERTWYKCPKCSRDVWSWKLVSGITCMKCMGFEDVQTWGQSTTLSIANGTPSDADSWNEIIQLLINFFRDFGFQRSVQLILGYLLPFYRVVAGGSNRPTRETNEPETSDIQQC